MNTTKLYSILEEMYTEAYKQATPSADYNELIKNANYDYLGRKVIDYNAYYLPSDDLDRIFDEVCSRYKLNKIEIEALKFEYYLGSSPTSKKHS